MRNADFQRRKNFTGKNMANNIQIVNFFHQLNEIRYNLQQSSSPY